MKKWTLTGSRVLRRTCSYVIWCFESLAREAVDQAMPRRGESAQLCARESSRERKRGRFGARNPTRTIGELSGR